MINKMAGGSALRAAVTLLVFLGGEAQAQPAVASQDQLQEVIVTGSRIARIGAEAQQPLSIINREAIDKTNLQSLGELLQQLTTGGSALNTKFDSSGNFGYPPDGGGIGAGSWQVDLRNLDSKRVLVLVDGVRWVNESSASGVSGSADLNTIPLAIVERIEVLEDGASAIYGSDAIAGDGNVSTRQVGVEINNGSIPRIRVNSQLGWSVSDWRASWIVRYIHSVTEPCASALVADVPGCEAPTDFNVLRSVVYNDVQLEWRNAFALNGLKVADIETRSRRA